MEYVKLGDICNIKSSKRIYQSEYSTEGVPFYRGKEISQLQRGEEIDIELFISREKFEAIKKKYGVIKKGDLLITSVGTIGNTWVSDGREFYYKDGNITQIESNDNINTKFIAYLFKSNIIKRQYLKGTSGTAQVALTIEKLNKLQIPNIDLKRQNKIVETLDKAQELIDKRKEQIDALDELVKSKFIEMFGDPYLNPKGWEVNNYEEICNFITDGEHTTPKRCDEGIYLLSARNVLNHSLQLDDVDFIDEDEYIRISKRIVPEENDILISCSGSVGRVCKVPKNFKFQMVRSVAILKLNENINATFMEWLIDSNYTQQQILKSINQSSQANLFQGKIKQLKAIVPPMELQNQFADFVKQIDKLKFEMENSLKELEDNFNSLMQKAFKGELFN